jgi:hypothetical protein
MEMIRKWRLALRSAKGLRRRQLQLYISGKSRFLRTLRVMARRFKTSSKTRVTTQRKRYVFRSRGAIMIRIRATAKLVARYYNLWRRTKNARLKASYRFNWLRAKRFKAQLMAMWRGWGRGGGRRVTHHTRTRTVRQQFRFTNLQSVVRVIRMYTIRIRNTRRLMQRFRSNRAKFTFYRNQLNRYVAFMRRLRMIEGRFKKGGTYRRVVSTRKSYRFTSWQQVQSRMQATMRHIKAFQLKFRRARQARMKALYRSRIAQYQRFYNQLTVIYMRFRRGGGRRTVSRKRVVSSRRFTFRSLTDVNSRLSIVNKQISQIRIQMRKAKGIRRRNMMMRLRAYMRFRGQLL